jgi:hypothetical protein
MWGPLWRSCNQVRIRSIHLLDQVDDVVLDVVLDAEQRFFSVSWIVVAKASGISTKSKL